MTRKTLANLKIIGATAMCVFSLATAFTATFAWFANNRDTVNTGMTIRVVMGETDVQALTVHRCILSESTNTLLKFDSTPSVTVSGHGAIETGSGIEMDNYSTLNQTQPVLLLLKFNEGIEAQDVNITATADANQFYSYATSNSSDANYIGAFPFSSTITFKCATYTSETFPFDNVEVEDLGSPSSFVNFIKDEDNAIVSNTFDSTLDLYTGSGDTRITYIAVVLDYYAEAIDHIVNHTDFEVFSSNNNRIAFTCDWILEL